ncbi:MAG TPA: ABC transporter substrate-binding protein [Candidatus Binatia bacterium]|nr:ABC transporter substrate-binding protein [Candidatus Binatia bacterium]
MRKKSLGFALSTLLLALSFPAQAQQQKIYRIGVVYPGGPLRETIDGLRAGLKELGLAEGKQFTLAIEDIKGDIKAGEAAAKNFEREKVDLIFVTAGTVIAAAKQATTSVPIVFCIGSDPVAAKLVDDFARPGGRLTGVHYLARDLTAKRLEILKEILPKLSRVVTFYNPATRVAAEGAAMAREEAKRLGVKLLERHVKSSDELRKGLQALKAGEADALIYIPDATVISQAQLIIDTAKAKKLPTMFQDESLVAQGGLASYGQNYQEIGRLAAKYVQRVLSGTSPKDLRIETIENTDLTINLKTAKELGVNIPAQVLARARRVIK